MMQEHFGLSVNPFGIAPRLDFLYRSAAFEESMAHLVYGLDNNEAVVMITGEIGLGKTMAVQSFLSHLGDAYVTALVTNTTVDGKELLKLILEDLGAELIPGADKSDLLIQFKNVLLSGHKEGKRVIVVIDEAQNLSRDVLEEIRQLTNLGQGANQPVQIVLVGQPELEAAVARPDLAQLRQRIRVHYKLEPLSRKELEEYIDHRMVTAGGSPGTFSRAALDKIHALSRGVPRVVNTLGGEALLSAYVAGRRTIEEADIGSESVDPGPQDRPTISAVGPAEGARSREKVPEVRPVTTAESPSYATYNKRERGDTHRHRSRNFLVVLAVAVLAAAAGLGADYLGWIDLPLSVRSGPGERKLQPGHLGAELQKEPDVPAVTIKSAIPADDGGAAGSEEPVSPPPASATDSGPESAADPAEPVLQVTVDKAAESGFGAGYWIHISSFLEMNRAESMAARFAAEDFRAVIKEPDDAGDNWVRVYLGPFAARSDAVRAANRLLDAGRVGYYKIVQPSLGTLH